MKLFLILLCLASALVAAQPSKKELEDALAANPDDRSALYNLGLMHYLENEFGKATDYWNRLKVLEPNDWQVRAKLIQSYWGEGKKRNVEKEIGELRKARASGKHKELNEKNFFIRDQFQVGEIRVFVLEYYEFKGDRPLLWKFLLRSKKNEALDRHLSVGSYPSTTAIMKASDKIGPNDRAFHLDGYWTNGNHETYGIYRSKPEYGVMRKRVGEILTGKKKAISSMIVETGKDKAEKSTTKEKPSSKDEKKPKNPKLKSEEHSR